MLINSHYCRYYRDIDVFLPQNIWNQIAWFFIHHFRFYCLILFCISLRMSDIWIAYVQVENGVDAAHVYFLLLLDNLLEKASQVHQIIASFIYAHDSCTLFCLCWIILVHSEFPVLDPYFPAYCNCCKRKNSTLKP